MSETSLKRTQLADQHLTYIGAAARHTTYDVYLRTGGWQLGIVQKINGHWVATDLRAPPHRVAGGNTRWEAATKLWPENTDA